MNERIKELAEQAGITMFGDAVYMTNSDDILDVSVMNKFADLIVKEVESYIEEAEGDIDLVQFLIERYLK